jgi:hypothetical protein
MNATTIDLPPSRESEPPRRRSGGRVAVAIALAAVGVVLALAGAGAIGLQLIAGDDDGYLTKEADLSTDSFALATDEIDLDSIDEIPSSMLGTVRIRIEPDGDQPAFVGIGPTDDVQRYLRGVRHAQVSDFGDDGDARYEQVPGGPPRKPPGTQAFWSATSAGPGGRQLDWKPQDGKWEVVAMNADGSRGVSVHAEAGAKLGWLIWTGLGFALAGIALIGLAVWVSRPRVTTSGATSPAPADAAPRP